jgi:CRP/FNR family cyclic AMP-dependent transcriptional regulator
MPVDPALGAAPLFRGLQAADADALAAQFTTVRVARDDIIFEEGQPADALYVVLTGLVKLARGGPNGRKVLVGLMGPSDEFGELSLFDAGLRVTTAIAARRGRVASLPGAVLEEWLHARPQIAHQLLGVLARRLRHANNFVGDYVLSDAKARIAQQLIDLARRFGTAESSGLYIRHGLTQDELAELVGTSRETWNRVLASFAARGWLQLDGRTLILTNRERIAHLTPRR